MCSHSGSYPVLVLVLTTVISNIIVIIIATVFSLFNITTLHIQRHGVVIETCMVGISDSAFLQQAAHITEGLYLRPRRTGALLQYLLVSISDLSLVE